MTPAQTTPGIGSYILFTVAATTYALPSAEVRHIEMLEEITRVPNAPSFVDGVVFSRGQVVPVVNLRARFGFERVPFDLKTRLVVVQAGTRLIGLVADSARELLFRASRGLPRVAAHLLRRALYEAHLRNQTFIDDHAMEAAIDQSPVGQVVLG